jgi:tetratricopeptide (TPR) repeat protein
MMREGKLDDALALYRQTFQVSPNSVPANIAAGSVFDIMCLSEEARTHFSKAIQVADTPEQKAMAQRAKAMSYAFEGNCERTVQYEQQVFDFYGSVKNSFNRARLPTRPLVFALTQTTWTPPITGMKLATTLE